MINLDNNATTVPSQAAVNAVTEALRPQYGNPSSAHGAGDAARVMIEGARFDVAELINCEPSQIIFTGSGTEANNLALHSLVGVNSPRIITSTVEHSSVLNHVAYMAHRGLDVVRVNVDTDGRVQLHELETALQSADRSVLSIQWVNNETGCIQPVDELIDMARSYNAQVHIDSAQAIGKLDTQVDRIDPDFLTFTAHKINGLRGIGALYARDPRVINPLRFGGTQEQGIHPGTENLAGIVSFGAAARERLNNLSDAIELMRHLRDVFEHCLLNGCPWAKVNGSPNARICNTTNIRFNGIDGQALMARLDTEGVLCSQSSACTNQKPEPSYVLRAMGLSESEAYESVRFSTGVLNTEDEILEAAQIVAGTANQLRKLFR